MMRRQNYIGLIFLILIAFIAIRSNAACPILKNRKKAYAVVKASSLNVRKGAGLEYATSGASLENGSSVAIWDCSSDGKWLKIGYDRWIYRGGKNNYVKLVSEKSAIASSLSKFSSMSSKDPDCENDVRQVPLKASELFSEIADIASDFQLGATIKNGYDVFEDDMLKVTADPDTRFHMAINEPGDIDMRFYNEKTNDHGLRVHVKKIKLFGRDWTFGNNLDVRINSIKYNKSTGDFDVKLFDKDIEELKKKIPLGLWKLSPNALSNSIKSAIVNTYGAKMIKSKLPRDFTDPRRDVDLSQYASRAEYIATSFLAGDISDDTLGSMPPGIKTPKISDIMELEDLQVSASGIAPRNLMVKSGDVEIAVEKGSVVGARLLTKGSLNSSKLDMFEVYSSGGLKLSGPDWSALYKTFGTTSIDLLRIKHGGDVDIVWSNALAGTKRTSFKRDSRSRKVKYITDMTDKSSSYEQMFQKEVNKVLPQFVDMVKGADSILPMKASSFIGI